MRPKTWINRRISYTCGDCGRRNVIVLMIVGVFVEGWKGKVEDCRTAEGDFFCVILETENLKLNFISQCFFLIFNKFSFYKIFIIFQTLACHFLSLLMRLSCISH